MAAETEAHAAMPFVVVVDQTMPQTEPNVKWFERE